PSRRGRRVSRFGVRFDSVDVVTHDGGNTDDEHGQVCDRLVPHAERDVDAHARVQLDLLVVEDHGAVTGNDVVDLVGVRVVVELGVVDLDVVDLGTGAVGLLDQAADLPAGLGPGLDLRRVASQ